MMQKRTCSEKTSTHVRAVNSALNKIDAKQKKIVIIALDSEIMT